MATYLISDKGAFVCLHCGRASWNPNDIKNKYCGHCHVFHKEEPLVCDFCMNPSPIAATIKAERKLRGRLPGGTVYVDDDQEWAACKQCHSLIKARNWQQLVLRGISHTVARNPTIDLRDLEELREKIVFIYAGVFGDAFEME